MSRIQVALTAVMAAVGMVTTGRQEVRGQNGTGTSFVRGDGNADGTRDLTDAVYMLGCNFLGTECGVCSDAGDANDDGEYNITDPIYLLNFLFSGGPDAPAPGAACGPDPTADSLTCASFPPCAVTSNPDAVPTAKGDVIVKVIEHATLALLWDGKTIYVDPVGGAGLFAGLPPPDIILVTDIHGDHMEAATLKAVVGDGAALVVPSAVSQALAGAGGVPGAEEKVLQNGDKVTVEGIEIEAIPMYNLTPDRLRYHAKGRGNGYVLDLAGTRVYIAGDTEDIPEMRALQDIGLAFLCMNLPFTMTPQQAASAVLEFKPRVVYPYHYRGQNTEQFRSLVEADSGGIEVRLRNWY